jgi:hypothetical protein
MGAMPYDMAKDNVPFDLNTAKNLRHVWGAIV